MSIINGGRMKKSIIAIILLLGIIILGSCQNQDVTSSTPGSVNESLFGTWERSESKMTIIFNEKNCTVIDSRQRVPEKYLYTYDVTDNFIRLIPINGGKLSGFSYRIVDDTTLDLDGKTFKKKS